MQRTHVLFVFLIMIPLCLAQVPGDQLAVAVQVDKAHVPVGVIVLQNGGKQCGGLIPDMRLMVHDHALQNAVVSLSSPMPNESHRTEKADPSHYTLTLKDCAIWPRVQSATVQDRIVIANQDAANHEVLITTASGAELARTILPPQVDYEFEVSFPGRFKLQCIDHPWESHRLWVFEHPFHGVTNEHGIAEIPVFCDMKQAQFEVQHELWSKSYSGHASHKGLSKIQLKLQDATMPAQAQWMPQMPYFTSENP